MKRSNIMVTLMLSLASNTAIACYAPRHEQTVHYEKLIDRTKNIVLAKVVEKNLWQINYNIHKFEVIEIIKGESKDPFLMIVEYPFGAESEVSDHDFNGHKNGLFWDKKASRQWNWPDCEMHPFFDVNKTYLIFVDQPFHWKSFELINKEDDRWLKAVIKYIKNNGKRPGFSQSIIEYLKEKKSVYRAEVDSCSDGEYGSFLRIIKTVDPILGENLGTSNYYPDFGKCRNIKCEEGLQFLAVHYLGEDSKGGLHPSAFPIVDGKIDFSCAESEIHITGEIKIGLKKLTKLLKN